MPPPPKPTDPHRAVVQIAVAKFPSLHPLQTQEISPQELMLAREADFCPASINPDARHTPASEVGWWWSGCGECAGGFCLLLPLIGPRAGSLSYAGETYELATLLSVKAEDVESFERHIAKAKTLYNDYK